MRRKFIVLLSLAYFAYVGAIVANGLSAEPGSSDLAVVLGNEVLAGGMPSARLKARLDCAVLIYRRHLAPLILVSGGVGKSGFDEASVMADYLRHQHIPASAILTDSKGINTMATAINTASLAKSKHFTRILIVTQYYHIPRTLYAFRKAGLPQTTADYPRYFELGDIVATLHESVAMPVYLIKMSDKQ